jgi:hypothetical protein
MKRKNNNQVILKKYVLVIRAIRQIKMISFIYKMCVKEMDNRKKN